MMTQEELAKARRIYISGAITGKPIEKTRAEFKETEGYIRSLGLVPVNPFNNGLTPEHTWLEHIHRDIDLVASCGAIFMVDGWFFSHGASIEREVAMKLNLRVFYEKGTMIYRCLLRYIEEIELQEERGKEQGARSKEQGVRS